MKFIVDPALLSGSRKFGKFRGFDLLEGRLIRHLGGSEIGRRGHAKSHQAQANGGGSQSILLDHRFLLKCVFPKPY
jgi:hypothetical protein